LRPIQTFTGEIQIEEWGDNPAPPIQAR
jgi:hypothetical protein